MKLSTRLTVAMVALVALTAMAVGVLNYYNVVSSALPRALDRIDTHAKVVATLLEGSIHGARADVGTRGGAIEGLASATSAGGVDPASGASVAQLRSRIASRFVAELRAKPTYAQLRIIGIADGGRELVRVDRMGPGGAIRVVPDAELQRTGDRDYFKAAIGLPAGEIHASPIDFNRAGGVVEAPAVPTLRIAASIPTPDGRPFGIMIVNLDMRPAFSQLRNAGLPGADIYLVNGRGEFLVHPDLSREFGFEYGAPLRVQDEFPAFADILANGSATPRIVENLAGARFGVGVQPVRLANGPAVTVIEAVPYAQVMAAFAAVRDSSLLGGLAAVLCATLLAVVIARSLTGPLVQMTAAVENFARDETISIPANASGEIGVLANAFARMGADVRDKTAALKREIEERSRLFETSPDLILVTDRQGNFIRINPSSKAILGYDPGEMIGHNAIEFVYPDDLEPTREEMRKARRGRQTRNFESRYIHRDGRVVTLAWSGVWSEPEQRHFFIGRDMTEQRFAEAALSQEAEERRRIAEVLNNTITSMVDPVLVADATGRILIANPPAQRLFGKMAGVESDEQARPYDRYYADGVTPFPFDRTPLYRAVRGEPVDDLEYVVRPVGVADGGVHLIASGRPLHDSTGALQGAVTIYRDITESKKAQEALRESEEVARGIIANSLDAIIQTNDSGNVIEWNPQAEKILGWSREEAIGRAISELYLPKDYQPRYLAMNEQLREAVGIIGERFEFEALRKDGNRIKAEVSMTGMRRRDGIVYNLFLRDITAKLAAEEQLRQSQKMEAVGQLTGGIAHDFNNMLTVITGTIDILGEAVADRPQLAAIAKLIGEAAGRGAELTGHLLAFARKQPLQPREIDVNQLVVDSAKLLRPALGERVEIVSSLDGNIWPALVDPTQLTTALFNLAVNARDAMPSGGKLTIETKNVVLDRLYADAIGDIEPGNYVLVGVSDTGTGIPAAIRDKVFEPFFSTKDVGKGTGLGLSMVYGFVKQSGGHIKIYSEEGHGTTVRIYLPQAGAQAVAAGEAAAATVEGGSETILVVEDNPLVLSSAITQLASLGYKTLAVAGPVEALALVDGGAAFDLLFTDVIMPGAMNGRDLADAVARRRPVVKVLFTSGYTEDAIIHHGRLEPGVLLLAKPYRKADLARMIRAALAAADTMPKPRADTQRAQTG